MVRFNVALASVLAAGLFVIWVGHSQAADDRVAHGKYLVTIMGCGDCHTPGSFFGKPDMAHMLSGSDVGFEIPGLGVFVGRNLTPDKETGLGNWSEDQIVAAFTTGRRPDGRILSPAMPWMDFAALTKDDSYAIAAYLKSLPPTRHAIPGPFAPTEKATVFVYRIVPGGGMTPPAK
ncbi:MAG TPA: cytochrome c [Stellaceae bacterium]|jgi:mono/diheme cytochrome c family protein|nr:cytochrome c [Stellaceae bacterium]